MSEVLVFPDATHTAIVYLRAQLVARSDNAVVGSVVPHGRGRFVRVHRTGGVRRQIVIEDTTLLIACWADKAEDATDLAQLCRGLLGAMPAAVATVIGVVDADLSDERDPLSDEPFSAIAVTVSMRGAAT